MPVRCLCLHNIEIHRPESEESHPDIPHESSRVEDIIIESSHAIEKPCMGSISYGISAEDLDGVLDKVLEGIGGVHRMSCFFRKIVECENRFASELRSIVTSELHHRSMTSQSKGSCWSTWRSTVDLMSDRFKASDEFCKNVERFIVHPLDSFYKEGNKMFEEITIQREELALSTRSQRKKIEIAAKECMKDLKPLLKLQNGERRRFRSKEDSYKHVLEKCTKYAELVQKASINLQLQQQHRIPQLLSFILAIDERRIHTMKYKMEAFTEYYGTYRSKGFSNLDHIETMAKLIEVPEDLKLLTDSLINCTKDNSFKYDLPLSIGQIRIRAGQNAHKVPLSTSLDAILSHERRMYPNSRPHDIPLIFTLLRDAIIEQGGLRTEGIFRKSAPHELLEETMGLLEDGDMEVIFKDPHTPAVALKRWLQSLEEPLIPKHLYQRIDELCSSGKLEDSLQHDIFQHVGVTEQKVIIELVDLIRQVSDEEAEKRTKMSIEGISLVFSPIFLNPSDLTDALSIVKRAENGASLVKALLQIDLIPITEETNSETSSASLSAPQSSE